MTDIAEVLTKALAEHDARASALSVGWYCVSEDCDWTTTLAGPDSAAAHRAHLADELAPLVAVRERAAAERAWDEGYESACNDWPQFETSNPHSAAALATTEPTSTEGDQ